MRYSGEFAALGTALCWAAGSNFFAVAGRRMGAIVLNRLRITMALVFLSTTLLISRGSPWPTWASPAELGLLAASGLLGFVLGDNYYFRSLLILGPGRAAILSSLAPAFTALLGVPVLGERLGLMTLFGMGLTLAGLYWTLADPERFAHDHIHGTAAAGVAAGVIGALGQGGGFILSKLALRQGLDPLSATVVRVGAATACVWAIAFAGGTAARSVKALRDRSAAMSMAGGAFCGPFLGVTLSLFALKHTEAGVAASIAALYPLPTLLISSRVHSETITARKISGALVSIAGIVVLFLR